MPSTINALLAIATAAAIVQNAVAFPTVLCESKWSHSHLASKLALYSSNDRERSTNQPGIIFPGGGLFFYWQAGVIVRVIERTAHLLRFEIL
jgi:hypothetical protein